jgi:phenylalanyl-tRNA synthetase beta chain
MPTIDISLKDLSKLVGEDISLETLDKDAILWVKGEIDGFDDVDIVKIDCKETNRPDLWSTEGMARQIKPLFKERRGIPEIKVEESDIYLHVDRSVDEIRPYIAAAVVENIEITQDILKQLIQLQEKVCMTFGRKRKVVAMGLYDFNKIQSPITYKAVKPTEIKFRPLDSSKEMTPKEILKEHPKGIQYKNILKDAQKYPILIDSNNVVLSMPPIINSEASGKVTENTKNLFVEVTGTKAEEVKVALRVIIAALHDRGGTIKSVKIDYGEEKVITPNFAPRKMKIPFEQIEQITGLQLTLKELKELLEKFSYNVKKSKNALEVEYPAYRQDILHPIDVIEDILIAYGFNTIEPIVPVIATVGDLDPLEVFCESVRESIVGFGAQELLNFTLTSKEVLFKKMNTEEKEIVEIANPVSQRWTTFRNRVLPSLMLFFEKNTSEEYPQQIYELGEVVSIDENAETRCNTKKHLAWALASKETSFTKSKQMFDHLLKGLGLEYTIEEDNHTSFIEGRCGKVIIKGIEVACLGEIHPKVIENFGLNFPICCFEINISEIYRILQE